MNYREFLPAEALRPIVKNGWTLSIGGEPVRHVATPDGCMEIIRRFEGESSWGGRQPERFVAGLITRPTAIELGAGSSFIGVRLWPWAWNAIARLDCPDLVDRWADLGDAAPRIETPASIDDAFACFGGIHFDSETVALARAILVSRTVEELAARSGHPHRTLQRWFKRRIGIPPRHYLRLLRFQEAFVGVQRDDAPLADHAAAHGFADQAHMAREFRSISGVAAGSARKRATGPFF